MEEINKWLPLIQLVVVLIIIPLYKTIRNQEIQMGQLRKIITDQQKQIELLEAIVFESSAPEVIKKHLIHRSEHAKH